jgi:hypothetical protein
MAFPGMPGMGGMGGAGVDAGISDHEKKTIQMVVSLCAWQHTT